MGKHGKVRVLTAAFAGFFLLITSFAVAADVRNAKVLQDGSGVRFEYDLEGEGKVSEVTLSVTVDGTTRTSKGLHVEGDVGKVSLGKGKRIRWNVLQDFPKGLSGEFGWELKATGGGDHRSAFEKLPAEYYGPFSTDKYSACFDCHEKALALEKSTRDLTKFRNGDRNLHFVMVNKEKGRSCKACHRVDDRGKVIFAKEVPFGGSWKLPIAVTLTATGGSCVVGCHKPKSYDRLKPVSYD